MTRRECAALLELALAMVGALCLGGAVLYLAGRLGVWLWR
jgi:hypothetical protein